MTRAAFWFTQDLRIEDNPGLQALLACAQSVAFVYVLNPADFEHRNYQQKAMCHNRWRFLCESLIDLNKQLHRRGHSLMLLVGEPSEAVSQFIRQHNVQTLGVAHQVGWFEQQALSRIESQHTNLAVVRRWNTTLFNADDIEPGPLGSFSRFRNTMEKKGTPVSPISATMPQPWPAPFEGDDFGRPHQAFISQLHQYAREFQQVAIDSTGVSELDFSGGEMHAQNHLKTYFETRLADTYKQTRNELDDWSSSTKFSPYLAIGNISPKQIWQRLKQYEHEQGANDSTYWIGFELLWREYFQWLLLQNGKRSFLFQGNAKDKPLTSFYPERFAKWCKGETPYPLVNACMHQLNATGYMSNRGRQIVASCFVNELALDWRFGAAYFQQQLLDYDVASNWGNWQYIAGVGADPRGGRFFNIEKQTQLYDAKGAFITQWQGRDTLTQLDSVDAADWPI